MGTAAPFIAMGTSVLGSALGAAGQAQQAGASAAQAAYQAQVARNNQALTEINARRALAQGEIDADTQNLKTSQLMGRQRASLAAQGGDVNAGSNLDILGDTARAGEYDAATLRNNAAWKAYGYRTQGLDDAARASAADAAGANTMAELPLSIGSSLLGSASSIAGKWNAWFPEKTPNGVN